MKNNFFDIEIPRELMHFMDENISYGWLDTENIKHIDTLKNFRENYRIGSIYQTLSTGLGTCIDQAKVIKLFFDQFGIGNKLFCYREYKTEKILTKMLKCIVL